LGKHFIKIVTARQNTLFFFPGVWGHMQYHTYAHVVAAHTHVKHLIKRWSTSSTYEALHLHIYVAAHTHVKHFIKIVTASQHTLFFFS
jgi:hypothetical protein